MSQTHKANFSHSQTDFV